MLTHPQLAALAAWANVTPRSHRGCINDNYFPDNPNHFILNLPDPTDPAADPQVVDDVWFARVMWKMSGLGMQPVAQGRDPEHYPNFLCSVEHGYCSVERAESATLALLRAARAAGVREVVEIMEAQS